MKVTRVQYTVRSDFVAENERNIDAVMNELRALGNGDVRYAAYLHGDGKTFMHLVHHNSAEAERLPGALASFQHFRTRLNDHLEVPPKVETFELAQSSSPIF
jgi:hypothetical protein